MGGKLNMDALKAAQKEMQDRQSGTFFPMKKITEEFDVRIPPPQDCMKGLYYLPTKIYWVGKTKLRSLAIIGEEDVVAEELELALQENDPDLTDAIKNSDQFSVKEEYLFPFWKLGVDTETPTFGTAHIMECGSQLIQAITVIATRRQYQNGTEDGIFDVKKGFNLILGKTGEKFNTTYTCTGYLESSPVPKEALERIPDVMEEIKKVIGSPAYQRAVIRHYLYGEPAPEKEKVTEKSDKPEKASKGRPATGTKKESTRQGAKGGSILDRLG